MSLWRHCPCTGSIRHAAFSRSLRGRPEGVNIRKHQNRLSPNSAPSDPNSQPRTPTRRPAPSPGHFLRCLPPTNAASQATHLLLQRGHPRLGGHARPLHRRANDIKGDALGQEGRGRAEPARSQAIVHTQGSPPTRTHHRGPAGARPLALPAAMVPCAQASLRSGHTSPDPGPHPTPAHPPGCTAACSRRRRGSAGGRPGWCQPGSPQGRRAWRRGGTGRRPATRRAPRRHRRAQPGPRLGPGWPAPAPKEHPGSAASRRWGSAAQQRACAERQPLMSLRGLVPLLLLNCLLTTADPTTITSTTTRTRATRTQMRAHTQPQSQLPQHLPASDPPC